MGVKMKKKKKKKEKDDIMNFLLGVTKAKKKFETGKRKANRNKKGQKHRDSSSSSGSPSSSSESDSSNESSLSESSTCTESSSSSDVSSSSNSDYSDGHVLDILGVPDIQRKKSIQMFNAGLAPPPPKHTLDENEGSSEGSSAGFESSGSEGNEGSATKVIDTSEEEKKSGIISTTELSKPIDKVKTTVPKVEIVKLRLLMKKMIHNEKRLLGVIKMMDLDKSGKLSMIEFEKLAQKILKKQKEIVTSPALMALVWEDVLKHRQDMTQNEVGSYELCKWLEFGTDKKHVGHQHKHKHKHKQEKTEQEKKKEKKETDAAHSSSSSSSSGSGSGSGSEESDSDSDIGSDGKIRM